MLERVRDLLFTPYVDFVDYQDGLLVFRSRKSLKPERTRVCLRMTFGTVTADVEVQSYDEDAALYRGHLLDYDVVLENLHDERRSELRLPRALRVTSPALPEGKGVTEDISLKGARLVTSAPLQKDALLSLEVELDDASLPLLPVQALVLWTAKRLEGGYHSGLKFQPLDHKQVRMVVRYINDRIAAERKLHVPS